MRTSSLNALGLALLAVGCGGDGGDGSTSFGDPTVGETLTTITADGGNTDETAGTNTETGAGSNDGADSNGSADSTSGDGDGDTDSASTSGDGDTSDTNGDGDGDGDGDTSATSGDGDGDGDGDTSATSGDGDGDTVCTPNASECIDSNTYHVCEPDGSAWQPDVDCSPTQQCLNGGCVELCQLAAFNPSSIGCSFVTHHMDNFYNNLSDSIIVGNFSESMTANVTIYQVADNSNVETVAATTTVGPGQTYEFVTTLPEIDSVTALRTGGVYRVESDIPTIAYQHSPVGSTATNDASMLIPETAQGQAFIVASYASDLTGYDPYLNVIALEDNTTVTWTPPGGSAAGSGVSAVAAGGTGTVVMNRFDRMQIIANSGGDISGTIVDADKRIAVWGGSECENVPSGVTFCDHIEEQMLPLNYWGQYYVGAHAPQRGAEDYHWRVYAGKDGTTISADPAQPGFPITLNKGEYINLVTLDDVIFSGDGPFLPVQYLEGENGGGGIGDPSMYQMVPVGQFLSAYAFATGISSNYPYTHYVQVTRTLNGPDVLVDGAVVSGYRTVGNYQVADWQISEGSHFATSAAPFGITSIGYADVTSYAYPGGMNLLELNPQ